MYLLACLLAVSFATEILIGQLRKTVHRKLHVILFDLVSDEWVSWLCESKLSREDAEVEGIYYSK